MGFLAPKPPKPSGPSPAEIAAREAAAREAERKRLADEQAAQEQKKVAALEEKETARRRFAGQLQEAAGETDDSRRRFLKGI